VASGSPWRPRCRCSNPDRRRSRGWRYSARRHMPPREPSPAASACSPPVQDSETDLAVQVLIRPGDVASAEPYVNGIGIDYDARIADYFLVPGFPAGKGGETFNPG